jgi:hypothetical protein
MSVDNPFDKYKGAWILIAIMGLNIFSRLILVVIEIIRAIIQRIKRCRNRCICICSEIEDEEVKAVKTPET